MPLDAAAAARIYDRIGPFQDTQAIYEDAATRRLEILAQFDRCSSVFELGCGTGRFAEHLLTDRLPESATYEGVDVSPRMVSLAVRRLARWSPRATIKLVDGPGTSPSVPSASFDRFVANYVFDLLTEDDARTLIEEAARMLIPGGLLALVSLTRGQDLLSRVVSLGWAAVASVCPAAVGGCRPIELLDLVAGPVWDIEHREVVVRLGVPSEVLVARRTLARQARVGGHGVASCRSDHEQRPR